MRKAISNGKPQEKEGSGRRYWMRANPVLPKAGPFEGTKKRPPKARFLEPYRLSGERRAALIQLLRAGEVGDAESRELFASAIEYDIASARAALAREGPPAPARPEPVIEGALDSEPDLAPAPDGVTKSVEAQPHLPGDLAHTARSLAERIAGLGTAVCAAITDSLQARDPFRRGYDGAYLMALCAELGRLADAVEGAPQQPAALTVATPPADPAPPPPLAPDPPLGKEARRFLRRVVRVYGDVLEAPAQIGSGDTFIAVLDLVSGEAGVILPREAERLGEVLQGD